MLMDNINISVSMKEMQAIQPKVKHKKQSNIHIYNKSICVVNDGNYYGHVKLPSISIPQATALPPYDAHMNFHSALAVSWQIPV